MSEQQEFNDGHIIEGLDRLNSLMVMSHELLENHPAIIKAGLQDRLSKLQASIMDMYQAIGQLEEQEQKFSVIAGKHDGQDLNCKYDHQFDTLDQAIEAYDKVSVYPWAYIQYKNRTIDVWEEGNNPLGE